MKQYKRWLYLLLAGGILLEVSACTQKEPVTPSASDHIILEDYEIRYKGFTVMQDINENPALVINLDFTNNGKEATSYLWAVSEKAFQDGIGLDVATVFSDPDSYDTVTKAQLTEIVPGKTIEVKSAYVLPDSDTETVEVEFSQNPGKKKGKLSIDLTEAW